MAIVATVMLVACVTTPEQKAPPAPAVSPPPAEPAPPPVPDLPPKEAKALAQKQTSEALELLQNGDEAAARQRLEQAVRLDASNELARKLMDQIKADAQQELGSAFFRYTVQPEDSLSKLAERFLNDKYRFYILAKYNEMTNPKRLAVGQVIKIPGVAPPKQPPAKPTAKPEEAPKPVATPKPGETAEPKVKPPVEQEQTPRKEAERFYAQGLALQKNGNWDAAYRAYGEAIRREPDYPEALRGRDTARQELIKRYHRDATAAYHKQDLDLAIKKWDQVLGLDPDNEVAKRKRAEAIDLKQRIEKFPK